MKYCNLIYSKNEILQFRANRPEVKTGMRDVVDCLEGHDFTFPLDKPHYFAQPRLFTTEKLTKRTCQLETLGILEAALTQTSV